MEWREQTAVGCDEAFVEARRWMEEVTKKKFGSSNFRCALENGVLLCDLINKLNPGIIKKVNRLSTPIAGLDNMNVFLKACSKLGLNDAQLFHPGDLQDVSTRVTVRHQETSRRLKNVLITIYWLGRKAHADPSYHGPQLNFKAFEGLLGVALSKALEEASCSKSHVRDSGFAETWYPDKEEPGYRREDSVESLNSVESHTPNVVSDCTLVAGSDGFGSDAEAEHCFRMADPGKDGQIIPAAPRRKRVQRNEEGDMGHVNLFHSESGRALVSPCLALPPVSAFHQWARDYQSDSESDSERPEPDLVHDDLASRRFHSTTPHAPMNFAVPPNPITMRPFSAVTPSASTSWVTISDAFRVASVPHERSRQRTPPPPSHVESKDRYEKSTMENELLLRSWDEDSSESDEGRGSADPVQDDLYTRRVLQVTHQTSVKADSDKFLPTYWTPEEEAHVGRIRLGSQHRPWYKKMQGFSQKTSDSSEEDSDFDVSPWSKSLSDLTAVSVESPQEAESSRTFHLRKSQSGKASTLSAHQEKTRQYQAKLRESEAKWQEDLNKWKTRRQSVNSDMQIKEDEQEQVELTTNGTVCVGEEPKLRRCVNRVVPDVASDEAFPPSPLPCSSMPVPITSTGPVNGMNEASYHTLPVASNHVQSSSSTSMPASDTHSTPVPDQSLEAVCSGTTHVSAALPRGFRRSEGTSLLSTGVTPRPFSTKISRKSTQPRFYTMGDSYNGQQEQHQLHTSFPQQEIERAPDSKHDPRSGTHAALCREDEESGKRIDVAPSIQSFISASVLTPANEVDKAAQCDIRVSLRQTPNSGTDFGFQVHWDLTGARFKSIRPGSPAQLCHLQAGDEIVALCGQQVAEMSYEQWKANMDAALREGKLLMDIRRLSLNNGDHPDHHASIKTTSSLPVKSEEQAKINGHTVNGLPVKAMNRTIRDNPVSTINKGGSESAISDLQVPSISASSSHRSWNKEEERRRQEKWQTEQENLLQEKYRRDQERLEEAWRRDQQEAALEEISHPEEQDVPPLPSENMLHCTPPSFLHQSNSPAFVPQPQQVQEAPIIPNKRVQVAVDHPAKQECDSPSKTSQWLSESYGFTKLTASDRTKSRSSPSLDGSHKPNSRVSVKKKVHLSQAEQERLQILDEMRKKTPVLTDSSWIRQRNSSTVHKEPVNVTAVRRQESLDNIRSSTTTSSSTRQLYQSLSGLSGIVPYRGYSGRCSLGPGAAIFSTALKQNTWSLPPFISPVSDTEEECDRAQQHDRLESHRRQCSHCKQPLLKVPAMVIESLDLSFHVWCFKCVSCRTELRKDPESGAKVRIRHGQLFCDTCYDRL